MFVFFLNLDEINIQISFYNMFLQYFFQFSQITGSPVSIFERVEAKKRPVSSFSTVNFHKDPCDFIVRLLAVPEAGYNLVSTPSHSGQATAVIWVTMAIPPTTNEAILRGVNPELEHFIILNEGKDTHGSLLEKSVSYMKRTYLIYLVL